jgi:hypothetical protein
MFANRVLGRIFVPKKDKVTGECRTLCKEKLQALYSSQIITTQTIRWAQHVAHMGMNRGAYRVLVVKP